LKASLPQAPDSFLGPEGKAILQDPLSRLSLACRREAASGEIYVDNAAWRDFIDSSAHPDFFQKLWLNAPTSVSILVRAPAGKDDEIASWQDLLESQGAVVHVSAWSDVFGSDKIDPRSAYTRTVAGTQFENVKPEDFVDRIRAIVPETEAAAATQAGEVSPDSWTDAFWNCLIKAGVSALWAVGFGILVIVIDVVTAGGGFLAILAAIAGAWWALAALGGFVGVYAFLGCLENASGVNF
jgi:hypothetical protein